MRANENLHLIVPQVNNQVEFLQSRTSQTAVELLDVEAIFESATPSVDLASQVQREARKLADLAERMNFMMREVKSLLKT